MELTHENLEKLLKILMDKLKFSLGLDYRPTDYSIQLIDNLKADFIISKGDTVNIKIKTECFVHAIQKIEGAEETLKYPKENYRFRQILEKCLRLVPKMFNVLGNPAIAEALVFNNETGKFKKLSKEQLEAQGFERKAEKGIKFTLDYRATGIHWATGLIVREFGISEENAVSKARTKILSLLSDPEMYDRDSFTRLENHEDIVYDIVVECKILTKDEITQLIQQITKEYLK